MAPPASSAVDSSLRDALTWRPTKIMNMRDLSKDDDFLSHLLVEKLGTGAVPLLVHKMDPTRQLPKTDAHDLMTIVRRLVASKSIIQHAIRQAVDDLLALPPIRYYLRAYTQKQVNAFATHASRYFELYNPHGYIEIAHTSRYSHRTGKSELCILATRGIPTGTVITELKGSMANLTDEEDRELKRTDLRHSDVRRDFSVIHSKQMKKNHLFLGPARFVNHDCDNNCELFREGKYITFRTLRAIPIGAEITAHYGDSYFGRKNRYCLCETCEKQGRGGYAPENAEEDLSPSDSDSDIDSDSSSSDSEQDGASNINFNERRTRRRVYAITTQKDDDSDDSDDEAGNIIPLAGAKDIPADGDIELTTDAGTPSELTSLAPSVPPSDIGKTISTASISLTHGSDSRLPSCSSLSSLSGESASKSCSRSIISTRSQKARAIQQLDTPPLSEDADPPGVVSKRVTRSASALQSSEKDKGKTKAKDLTPTPIQRRKIAGKIDQITVKKEEIESRSLRNRPSPATQPESSKDQASRQSAPRGPDGKLLPTCITCSNVLPVISVDSKVVWGLVETSPRKKKNKQECPRCMRHSAIYGQPWPSRHVPHGSAFLPTPREEATPTEYTTHKRLSKKSLTIVNSKLTVAMSALIKQKHRDDPLPDERPAKRQKTDHPTRVEAEPKLKGVKVFLKVKDKKRSVISESVVGEKRKRGRPRLTTPRRKIKEEEKVLNLDDPQPRNSNGRFEKKDLCEKHPSPVAPPSPTHEAIPKREPSLGEPDEIVRSGGAWTSPRRKRPSEPLSKSEPKRQARRAAEANEDLEPPKKILPRSTSNFKGSRLFTNPNPLSFALQAWAGPVILDESSEDERAPVTPPEDDNALVSTIIEADETPFPSPALPLGALTFKPSPFNFAKRRWVTVPPPSRKSGSTARDEDPSRTGDRKCDEVLASRYNHSHGGFFSRFTFRPQDCFGDEESLIPFSDDYPSALSPEDHGQGFSMTKYPVGTPFASEEGPAPNLVNAGWDSCSELSDI